MTTPKFTPEERAEWVARGQEYVKIIDQQIEGWRKECADRMIAAAIAGEGWAGNKEI